MNMTISRRRIFSALLLLITTVSRAAEGETAAPKTPELPAWKLASEEHWIVDKGAEVYAKA